jgi:hypothetical protein
MQLKSTLDVDITEVDQLLPEELQETWRSLKAAVVAGHAMFLRATNDGDKTTLRFFVKGFQSFFAAGQVLNDEGVRLPDFVPLVTDQWWSQMLEMLADCSPHVFVKVMENRLKTFEKENGNTFLHVAAQFGHRPIFQLLEGFEKGHRENIFVRNTLNRTPLHVAAETGNTFLCKTLLEHKAFMDVEDSAGCLPMHVAMQNGHFVNAQYLLGKWNEVHANKEVAPGSKEVVPASFPAQQLAERVLSSNGEPMSEEDFKKKVNQIFVELKFFGPAESGDYARSMGALLAVYWVAGNYHELFVRGQPDAKKISKETWGKLQTWATEAVGLTTSVETMGAMLVFSAIQQLGKIVKFRKTFAPGYDDFTEALAFILKNSAILVPSFWRLPQDLKDRILFSLKADFNFGQFLQAENLPANLSIVSGFLTEGGEAKSQLGFFLFTNFAKTSGVLSPKSMEGCLLITEEFFGNYHSGLDVIQHLVDERAEQVNNRFLSARAARLQEEYDANDADKRALVRMLCISRCQDPKSAERIKKAWFQLEPDVRSNLVKFLNVDGIKEKPGFLLFNCPNLLSFCAAEEAAGKKKVLSAMDGMRALLKIYQAAAEEYQDSKQPVVTIAVDAMVKFATDCTDAEVFDFVKFEIARAAGAKHDKQARVKIAPWQLLNDTERLEQLRNEGEQLSTKILAGSLKEQVFLSRLERVFPELQYLKDNLSSNSSAYKQTIGSLLSVYWTVGDQAEAFTRGHNPDEKLSETSWAMILDIMQATISDSSEVVDAFLVAMTIHQLGKVQKLSDQLAPGVKGHRKVLAHVMDTCPKVLPSYSRLDPQYQQIVRNCVTADFDFTRFMKGEILWISLQSVQTMLQKSCGVVNPQDVKSFYVFFLFASIAGSLGAESNEGSLYMTEERFSFFIKRAAVIRQLGQAGAPIHDIYTQFAKDSAASLDVPERSNAAQAIVRLVALAYSDKSKEKTYSIVAKEVMNTFLDLSNDEQAQLKRHLVADSVVIQAGTTCFTFSRASDFFSNAWSNKKCGDANTKNGGLKAAFQLLLRICHKSAQDLGASNPVLELKLGKLAEFAKEFFGSVPFQDVPFEVNRVAGQEYDVVPKAWIPVHKGHVLETIKSNAKTLVTDLLDKNLTEKEFKDRIRQAYPEIGFFSSDMQEEKGRTYGALMSLFWLITENGEAFCRGQPDDEQLTKQSWVVIQEWVQKCLKAEDVVDAMLSYMAIHALGRIPNLHQEFAPEIDAINGGMILGQVLTKHPEVVPSFLRLTPKYQKLIIDCSSVDFQFSQFLQAENVPASLQVFKEKIAPHHDDGFSFFCICILSQMCGRSGYRDGEGSLFMNESQWQRFRPGLDALHQLRKLDASSAYTTFLLFRSSNALFRFASKEHYAIARVLCLASAFDQQGGLDVLEAFDELESSERSTLVQWLTADGIKEKPGYVLSEASLLIEQAKANHSVGIVAALRMLIRVQEGAEKVLKSQSAMPSKVMLQLDQLGQWARDADQPNEFAQAAVSLRCEGSSETKIFTVEVHRPGTERTASRGAANSFDVSQSADGNILIKPEVHSLSIQAKGIRDNRIENLTALSRVSVNQMSPPPRITAQLETNFKPPSRTRHLAQVLRAQRQQRNGIESADMGTVTRL